MGIYVVQIGVISTISYFVCEIVTIAGVGGLIIRAVVCIVVSNGIFIVCNMRKREFKYTKQLFRKVLKNI